MLRSWPRLLACAFALAGCTQAISPPADTGIDGLVTLGPLCPVVTAEKPCPDRPYAAPIRIETSGGDLVTTLESDEAGRFSVPLHAGVYRLVPLSPTPGTLPYAAEQVVTVEAGRYTQVHISYDTGIR
ncbi:MAG: hypothetical protein ACRELV_01875 [Longimicrobiales bacterium]